MKLAYDYGLPKDGIIDKNGVIEEPSFAGMNVLDVETNEAIADALR